MLQSPRWESEGSDRPLDVPSPFPGPRGLSFADVNYSRSWALPGFNAL